MKKKLAKKVLLVIVIILTIFAVFNTYKWIVYGEQNIKITATTNNSNVEITGINTKLGVQKAQTNITNTTNR